MTTRPWKSLRLTLLVAAMLIGINLLWSTVATQADLRTGTVPDIVAACQTNNPFLASPCLRGILRAARDALYSDTAPALIMFNDTPSNSPQFQLANFRQVGAVWGLAFNPGEPALYAGAYLKRQLPFGPGGPGAIYRVDMKDAKVTPFATIPNAGPDVHANRMDFPDDAVRPLEGRSGLGDIDFNDTHTELLAMNLAEKKIYRLAFPGGQVLGSIEVGSNGLPWAADARPFALAFHNGHLYHGIVNSCQSNPQAAADLVAYVYQSDPDGANMKEVAKVPLGYARGTVKLGPGSRQVNVKWQCWKDSDPPNPVGDFPYAMYPQPLLTDIEFDNAGNMILGLRDRTTDSTASYLRYLFTNPSEEKLGVGVGDVLAGTVSGTGYQVDTDHEFYNDQVEFFGAESGTGGLAYIPWLDQVVTSGIGLQDPEGYQEAPAEGFLWLSASTGDKARREKTCAYEYTKPVVLNGAPAQRVRSAWASNGEIPPPPVFPTYEPTPDAPVPVRGPGSTGDVELLCPANAQPAATTRPTPNAVPTRAAPPTPASGAAVPKVCSLLNGRVPKPVIDAKMAAFKPNLPCNSSLPTGPHNPSRAALSLQDPGKPYHPLFNDLVWKCSCP